MRGCVGASRACISHESERTEYYISVYITTFENGKRVRVTMTTMLLNDELTRVIFQERRRCTCFIFSQMLHSHCRRCHTAPSHCHTQKYQHD